MISDRSRYAWRKIHSLTGIVPLGVYMCMHLFLNSFVLFGKGSFVDGVALLHRMPYLPVLEWLMIYIPISIHIVIGVAMILEARYNPLRYGYPRNWWFWFQRMSAVVLIAFIAWHVWSTRIQLMLGRVEVDGLYELLQDQFHNPLILAFYVLGITAVSLHLGNGLWGFLVSWGIVDTKKSQRAFAGACIALGALVLAGFVNVAYHYTSGKTEGGLVPIIEGEQAHPAAVISTVEILD